MKINIKPFNRTEASETSKLIIRNLKEVNNKDYGEDKINELVIRFNEENVASFEEKRHTFTAKIDKKVVGTLSVVKAFDGTPNHFVFLTIFVSPDFHGQGVGKQLIMAGEDYVKTLRGKEIFIPSSITSHVFYHKLGYTYHQKYIKPDQYGCIPMFKTLEV